MRARPSLFPLPCLAAGLLFGASSAAWSAAWLAACLAAPLATPVMQAQTAGNSTLSVNANLVNLPVTVRDKKGRVLTNLTQADFKLEVDGAPQLIRYFALDTNLPLTLLLDVDTSQSVSAMLDAERTASHSFLDQLLATPGDKAAVLHFDREVELLQDVTANKGGLMNALDELGPTPKPANEDNEQRRRGGTALYDSIYLAAHDVLARQTGRKAIIVLSDGEDRGSQETLHDAIAAAQRSEVVVYTIYFEGEKQYPSTRTDHGGYSRRGGMGYPGGGYPGRYPGGGYPGGGYPGGGYPGGGYPGGGNSQPGPQHGSQQGKKIMQQIAGETGGDFFEVKKKENYDEVYKAIADELRQQYRLGFTPTGAESTGGFHTVSLTTSRKDQYVQTRSGYYGKDGDAATPPAAKTHKDAGSS